MKKVRNNNEGFSLVELIIVIAIMAILAGALAPQLIKYIDNSRKSTDVSSAQTIATAVSVALANEAAYNQATATATVEFMVSECLSGAAGAFESKVGEIIGAANATDAPKPKYNSNTFNDFAIVVTTDATTKNVSFAIYPVDNNSFSVVAADMLYPTVGTNYAD